VSLIPLRISGIPSSIGFVSPGVTRVNADRTVGLTELLAHVLSSNSSVSSLIVGPDPARYPIPASRRFKDVRRMLSSLPGRRPSLVVVDSPPPDFDFEELRFLVMQQTAIVIGGDDLVVGNAEFEYRWVKDERVLMAGGQAFSLRLTGRGLEGSVYHPVTEPVKTRFDMLDDD